MARILCVWSPNWPITAWRRRTPSPPPAEASAPALPFALIANEGGVRRLVAVDARAQAMGLHPGQKAADAAALVPNLATADHDAQADAQALELLADWCVRFSPAVASDAPDGLFLDVSGGDLLWGGEAALAHELEARLTDNGIPVRMAIADTAAAAWALARFDPCLCPPGHQAAKLAPRAISFNNSAFGG